MNYRNPAECLGLLKQLHLANVDETHAVLTEIVAGLLAAMPAPNQHLEVLEALREQTAFVQAERARRYASHPLPPDSQENETLRSVVALWQSLAQSYAQIARLDAAEGTLGDQRALLAQRRLHYSAQALFEYFRARRALPPGQWSELHDAYSRAEAQGLALIRVPDALNEVWKAQSTCEAYIATLLVDLANPFGRTEREFDWICRWAQRFAPYCKLRHEAIVEPRPAAYGLDMAADHGLRPLGLIGASAATRCFDGSRLGEQIKAMVTQCRQGLPPTALGLGDCPTEAVTRLLVSLYRPWGLAAAGRRFSRRSAKGRVELCGDWLAIGFHVQGKVFAQPRIDAGIRSLRSDITLMTFGERAPEADPGDAKGQRRRDAEKLGFVCESWDLADQSVSGFRLRQRVRLERFEHHQLVGIRPPDGERFLLGHVSWLMYRADGVLEAGIHVLAGVPRVVAARQVGLGPGHGGAYQQAFMLPATPALKTPASLVLPGGWHHSKRIVEIHDGKRMQVRLADLLLRGTNFDQVSFELL